MAHVPGEGRGYAQFGDDHQGHLPSHKMLHHKAIHLEDSPMAHDRQYRIRRHLIGRDELDSGVDHGASEAETAEQNAIDHDFVLIAALYCPCSTPLNLAVTGSCG